VDLDWQPFPHAYDSTNDQLHGTLSTGLHMQNAKRFCRARAQDQLHHHPSTMTNKLPPNLLDDAWRTKNLL
jgi:hypothetical protein